MPYDVDVVFPNCDELFGEVDCVGKKFLGDGGVEVLDVKYCEGVLILICVVSM